MPGLTQQDACHLARRSGFSAAGQQVETLSQSDSVEDAVSAVISQQPSLLTLPSWHDKTPTGRAGNDEEKQAAARERRTMGRELKFWWFQQMIENSSPLQEKMTLFWANHFTSSIQKVKWAPAMLQQNLMLREHALGSFREMLSDVIRDPAMLRYLDNAASKKESPNENFARELLELFTMGEGEYTETDIKELARALTGASVDRRTGGYRFRRAFHDTDEKTIFEETANFHPDDVADLILRQPQVGPFITEKLWRFFIDDAPVVSTVSEISSAFVESDYQLSVLLEQLLLQPEFWQSAGKQIKSPMELMVGSIQLLEAPMLTMRQVLNVTEKLGQDLFDPPHVKGWAGGRAWYTTSTLPVREDVAAYFARNASLTPDIAQLLATESVAALPSGDDANYLSQVLSDPAYQVA